MNGNNEQTKSKLETAEKGEGRLALLKARARQQTNVFVSPGHNFTYLGNIHASCFFIGIQSRIMINFLQIRAYLSVARCKLGGTAGRALGGIWIERQWKNNANVPESPDNTIFRADS